ncbi:hypothetical protein AVEN_91877-1, partial [Araneus ventricosus]
SSFTSYHLCRRSSLQLSDTFPATLRYLCHLTATFRSELHKLLLTPPSQFLTATDLMKATAPTTPDPMATLQELRGKTCKLLIYILSSCFTLPVEQLVTLSQYCSAGHSQLPTPRNSSTASHSIPFCDFSVNLYTKLPSSHTWLLPRCLWLAFPNRVMNI